MEASKASEKSKTRSEGSFKDLMPSPHSQDEDHATFIYYSGSDPEVDLADQRDLTAELKEHIAEPESALAEQRERTVLKKFKTTSDGIVDSQMPSPHSRNEDDAALMY